MNELVVATGNHGKLLEIRELLRHDVKSVLSLADFPGLPPAVEDGVTFAENAVKKASQAARLLGRPVMADDSGLAVVALDGAPGVLSARFAGDFATDAENNAKLLSALQGVTLDRRGAAFHCVIALCFPDGTCQTFDGELRGHIGFELRGTGGFGYDPLFIVTEYGQTLAELSLEVKNMISHRARAMSLFIQYLQSL
jgi:XTP/dITP diphosphohydrolase